MNEFEEAFLKLKESVVRAAQKHIDNPEKAEAYIRKSLDNIWYVGKELGKQSLAEELLS